jgi:hypothetical protein
MPANPIAWKINAIMLARFCFAMEEPGINGLLIFSVQSDQ